MASRVRNFTLSWDGRMMEPAPAEETRRFRELAAAGRVEELRITFRPCVVGGKSAATMTGLEEAFLGRGIALELLGVTRTGEGVLARYRIGGQRGRGGRGTKRTKGT